MPEAVAARLGHVLVQSMAARRRGAAGQGLSVNARMMVARAGLILTVFSVFIVSNVAHHRVQVISHDLNARRLEDSKYQTTTSIEFGIGVVSGFVARS